jgi:hypothetical protein
MAEQPTQHLDLTTQRKRRTNRRTTRPGSQVLGESPATSAGGILRSLQNHHRRTLTWHASGPATLSCAERSKADLAKFFGTPSKGRRKAPGADPISRPPHRFFSANFMLAKGL